MAGGGGTGCNRTMSQSLGASRTLGALGLSVICQEGLLGRSSPPGTSLQGQNASLAAPRSRFCVGPPGSPLLCSAASEPPFQVHLHSLTGHRSPGRPWRCPEAATSLQSCLTLCDPIDGSPPGSPVPGILQARTLEWVAISFSSACPTLCDPMDCCLPAATREKPRGSHLLAR